MTIEVADEGESSTRQPSFETVQRDLKQVRQQEGVSIRRIISHGLNLARLSISIDEFRRSGSQPETLPMATKRALECAVRSYGPESVQFILLDTTLNFGGTRTNLTQRQQTVMDTLGYYSKTTYESWEKDVYWDFAFKIQQQEKSFCSANDDTAAVIAKLPFDHRVKVIRVLLDARVSMLPVNQDVLAEDVLRALPGLSSIEQLRGLDPLGKLDRVILVAIRSEYYGDLRQTGKGLPEDAFHIIKEIPRHYVGRQFWFPGNEMLAAAFDSVLVALLRGGGRTPIGRTSRPEFGDLWSRTDRAELEALAEGGWFFEGGEPTLRFDLARLSAMNFLATLLVELETANVWDKLLWQLPAPEPWPPPRRPPETRNPNRPKKTGDSWDSDD
ncbi:hypothetical protein [Mycolicibacterium alvei]|uniref:Uncharacterized protein n=1 Tax=Mycolicibacterium alvei TaxID=67081 RepID=A0A6N4UN21_9MYCO|nr:hypothetical protein [Mycolicibacterium alvei]MCV6999587.1 hypothetical protein [Mycolicibacterium alvei]BBX25017.1 hypothetical protein MALV_01420 [Mycolicibacterium alvei]